MPAEAVGEYLRGLEPADAVQAAARGRFLADLDDPAAVEGLIGLCVHYDRLRGHAARHADGTPSPAGPDPDDTRAGVLAMLEHQILAAVIGIVSGPSRWCSVTSSAASEACSSCSRTAPSRPGGQPAGSSVPRSPKVAVAQTTRLPASRAPPVSRRA